MAYPFSAGDELKASEINVIIASLIDDLESAHHRKGGYSKIEQADIASALYLLTELAQNITGVKTFGSIPVLPASNPTTDNQTVRKVYADSVIIILSASDNLKVSADTERSMNSTDYTKEKEIRINHGGKIRVAFDLKNIGGTGYGKIYKNGVAVGTERQTASGYPYQTFSEDIYVLPTDFIQLYIRNSAGGASYTYIQNFRIYYDETIGTNKYAVITD